MTMLNLPHRTRLTVRGTANDHPPIARAIVEARRRKAAVDMILEQDYLLKCYPVSRILSRLGTTEMPPFFGHVGC